MFLFVCCLAFFDVCVFLFVVFWCFFVFVCEFVLVFRVFLRFLKGFSRFPLIVGGFLIFSRVFQPQKHIAVAMRGKKTNSLRCKPKIQPPLGGKELS